MNKQDKLTDSKVCSRCNKEKPVNEFYKHKYYKNEIYYLCKECYKKDRKNFYQKYREKILKQRKKYREKNIDKINKEREEKGKWFSEYKLNKGCQICGYNKCVSVLEFHHLDPNKKDINGSMGAYSLKRIKKEIENCILLCANCHKELHANDFKRNNRGMFQ